MLAQLVDDQIERMRKTLHWIPVAPTPQQLLFLTLPQEEILYGGAAGGGKTAALLMAALQYVDVPGYSAVLLRRKFTDLMKSGSLIPLSLEWLSATAAKYNQTEKRWTFPSGATISFGYMDNENDKYQYQSAEYQFVGFDELTHFTKPMYTYLFSRLRRRMGVDVPLRMRAATNPGGVGHEWVRKRFIVHRFGTRRTFVPATLKDNPHLDADAYRKGLKELTPIERRRLEDGDWDVVDDKGVFDADEISEMYADVKDGVIGTVEKVGL